MAKISIVLQDGFEDDSVIVRVNGDEVYRKQHLSESMLTGLTDEPFSMEVPAGPVTVDVSLPDSEVSASTRVDPHRHPFIGIGIVGGRIEFRLSRKQFFHG